MSYNKDEYMNNFNEKFYTSSVSEHSMGDSLFKYIEIKMHDIFVDEKPDKIIVKANYDRTKGILPKEKNDKKFNYKRPTIVVENNIVIVNCYPGIDYVYHYASLISTYLKLHGLEIEIETEYPSQVLMDSQISASNLKDLPIADTIILGYVEGLEFLSSEVTWQGNGDFKWKTFDQNKLLVGCEHSYWGDIAGDVVNYLAQRGVKKVIYVGKLGTLNENYIPNESIATGNKSVFHDGSIVEWKNLFENVDSVYIKSGVHYSLPSIIQETNEWVNKNKESIDFVDPEIGHMAKAAVINNITFSYLHIISDSLVRKFDEDLSNERKSEIIDKRKVLVREIGKYIKKMS